MALHFIHFFSSFVLLTVLPFSVAQLPSTGADSCNGVYLSYTYSSGRKLMPNLTSDPTRQPYRFESVLTLLNNGLVDLNSWRVFVGFKHNEYLVSASNAVLADGTSLPGRVGNGTVFSGYPMTDLKTAVETAGDLTQIQVQVQLVGTLFGVAPPTVPLPSNISLVNDGWFCPSPAARGKLFSSFSPPLLILYHNFWNWYSVAFVLNFLGSFFFFFLKFLSLVYNFIWCYMGVYAIHVIRIIFEL